MTKLQKYGGYAALYEGIAYFVGMLVFIVVLDYPSITSPTDKLTLVLNKLNLVQATTTMIYIVFGIVLVILALALYRRLESSSRELVTVATVLGFIWAGLVIASGMIPNVGMSQSVALYGTSPDQALILLLTTETIATAIGGGNEIIGGLWTFLISLAALRNGVFPRFLNYLGLLVGAIGIVSTIPAIGDIAGFVFGLSQIVWFIYLGIVLLRESVTNDS